MVDFAIAVWSLSKAYLNDVKARQILKKPARKN